MKALSSLICSARSKAGNRLMQWHPLKALQTFCRHKMSCSNVLCCMVKRPRLSHHILTPWRTLG